MRLDGVTTLVLAVAVSIVAAVGLMRYVPSLSPPSAGFVVLDVVKLNNAFRATAAPLMQGGAAKSAEVAEFTLTSRRALEVVDEVAEGRPVLLRHAFVGSIPFDDITDDVIERLGLEPGSVAVDYPQLERSLAEGSSSEQPTAQRKNTWAKNIIP